MAAVPLNPGSHLDVEAYSLRDRKVLPLVHGPHEEMLGRLSPDGHWWAYVSAESGKMEIYVQPFPAATERWQISGGGGTMPQWRRDGRELYYVALDGKLMAAAIHAGATFAADAPRPLFMTRLRFFPSQSFVTRSQYDVLADAALSSRRDSSIRTASARPFARSGRTSPV